MIWRTHSRRSRAYVCSTCLSDTYPSSRVPLMVPSSNRDDRPLLPGRIPAAEFLSACLASRFPLKNNREEGSSDAVKLEGIRNSIPNPVPRKELQYLTDRLRCQDSVETYDLSPLWRCYV